MPKRAIAAFVVLFAAVLGAQTTPTLSAEMSRLKVDTVLAFSSSAIDDYPLWSPDARFLVAKVMGKWFKADLSNLRLGEARWHESRIGIPSDQKSFASTDESGVSKWPPSGSDQQEVVSASGIRLQLQYKELSTMLVLSKGRKQKMLWRTELEHCGGSSVSPDHKLAAFICETNGVLVIDIYAAYSRASR